MAHKQANPPSDAEQLATARTANGVLHIRLAEQEKIVRAQRAQLDDAHAALTAAGVPLEPHEPHEGCPTQLGHRVRLLAKERDVAEQKCAELTQLVGADTPIAAFSLAQTWYAEKAHMQEYIVELERRLAREGGR